VSFIHPTALLWLLVVPVVVLGYRWLEQRRERRATAWAPPQLFENMVDRPPGWRRHLPTALLLIGGALLLVGFARPQASVRVKRQDATVVLVVDVSGSMAARDSQPTRLGAARKVAQQYVDKLPKGYRVAVITFSDHTSLVAPPTHDLTLVQNALDRARSGPQGTALADAVVRAVNVAKTVPRKPGSRRPPAVIVLASDGGQTAGRVTPALAAQYARSAKIPVTTIALGTQDGVVTQQLRGGFTERIQVPVQPAVLQGIARSSGGRFVSGVAAVDTSATFDELGSRVGHRQKKVEVTSAAAAGGLVFLLAGAFVSGIWFRRLV
jgi:Ca-activated chloride channel family protein